eukprot:Trichotokara_eunicae@DN6225_c0_g1_i2.p3
MEKDTTAPTPDDRIRVVASSSMRFIEMTVLKSITTLITPLCITSSNNSSNNNNALSIGIKRNVTYDSISIITRTTTIIRHTILIIAIVVVGLLRISGEGSSVSSSSSELVDGMIGCSHSKTKHAAANCIFFVRSEFSN